jgi:hypothetical protein
MLPMALRDAECSRHPEDPMSCQLDRHADVSLASVSCSDGTASGASGGPDMQDMARMWATGGVEHALVVVFGDVAFEKGQEPRSVACVATLLTLRTCDDTAHLMYVGSTRSAACPQHQECPPCVCVCVCARTRALSGAGSVCAVGGCRALGERRGGESRRGGARLRGAAG